MEPEQSFLMIDMMKKIVTRGTGRGARVRDIEIAGKTGTTNDNKDGWFCGFTPSLQIITWFGNDDNSPMNKKETGGRVGAPAFRHFLSNMLKLNPHLKRTFYIPHGVRKSRLGNEEVFFTDKSKLPKNINSINLNAEDELNF